MAELTPEEEGKKRLADVTAKLAKKEAELAFNRSEEGKKLNSLLAAADKRLKQESAKLDTEEAIAATREAILATEKDISQLSTERGRELIQLEKDLAKAQKKRAAREDEIGRSAKVVFKELVSSLNPLKGLKKSLEGIVPKPLLLAGELLGKGLWGGAKMAGRGIMGLGRKAFAGGGVEAEAPKEEGETPKVVPGEPAAGKKPGFFDPLFAEPEKEKEIIGKDTVLEGTDRLIELAEERNDLLRDIFDRLPKPTAPSVKREEEIEAGKKKSAAMLAAAGGAGAGGGDGEGGGLSLLETLASWWGLDKLKSMWKNWRARRKVAKFLAAVAATGGIKGALKHTLKSLRGTAWVAASLGAAFIGMEVAEANEANEALDDLMKERETAKGEALKELDAKIETEMANVHEQEKDITQEAAGMGGAIAGMIAGAAIGTAVPIPFIGTGIGALIGTTAGYFGASWLGGMAHDMVKPQEDLVGVLREQEKEAARTANEAVKKAGDVEAAQAMLDSEAQSLRDEIAKHQAKIDKGDDRYGFGNVFSRKSAIENLEEELRIKEAALKTFQAPEDEVKPETTAAGTAPTVADEDTGRGDESIEGTGSAVLDDFLIAIRGFRRKTLFKAQERSVDEAEIKGLTEQQVQLQTEQTADQKIVADVLGQAQAGNTIPLAVALYSKEGKDLGIKSTAAGVPVQPTTTAVTVPQFLEPIKKAFLAVVDWFKGLWTWASDAISGVWTGLTEFIQGVWDGVVNWFKGLWAWDEKAGAAIAGAWTGVTDFIKGV